LQPGNYQISVHIFVNAFWSVNAVAQRMFSATQPTLQAALKMDKITGLKGKPS
jgi:hypothetical protein